MTRDIPPVSRPKAILAAALVCAATFTGCAHYYEPMSDWTGFAPGCHYGGFGWIGQSAAATGHEICTRALGSAGFLDVASQGSIGITDLHVDHGTLRIGNVEADSPSAKADVMVGDEILSIDGERVRDPWLARRLLFGRAGTPVFLGVRRADEIRRLLIVRERAVSAGDREARAAVSSTAPK